MTTSAYACVHIADFPAQALLRLRSDLNKHAVAVLEGRAPHERVCSLNRNARLQGAIVGMTRLEAETIVDLRLLSRCEETEHAARSVLLECLARFSPRLQAGAQENACSYVLDIAGTERLFGSPAQLAARLRSAIADAGLRCSIAVSENFHTARLIASAIHGVSVIPAGAEGQALGRLPIAALNLQEDVRDTFAMWGIRTLAELSALPEVDLIARMGQQALEWRQAARGELPHMFQPIEPQFELREHCRFEDPVEQMDSLLFIGARMLQSIVSRAAGHALSIASVAVRMRLQGGYMHERVLKPAVPSSDARFLLKLLQLEIAAHPPQAAVEVLEMHAEAGHCSTVQMGLFAPQTPELSRLDVTLARIKALIGEDRVGAPALEDTHRAGAFHMEPFRAVSASPNNTKAETRMVLRRMRPPMPVHMSVREMRPISFRDAAGIFDVNAAYGPWKTNGCWWSPEAWNLEEWDVLATRRSGTTIACLLVHDTASDQWMLEALYD